MANSAYSYSVRLDVNKCMGCTTCIKRCPTEAIRIVDGHARITESRCIDCGECIRVCEYKD
jgi:ferredoxin